MLEMLGNHMKHRGLPIAIQQFHIILVLIILRNVRPGKKRVLVLVVGRVDFDANKKQMRAAKCNTTPRKIPSLVFSSTIASMSAF